MVKISDGREEGKLRKLAVEPPAGVLRLLQHYAKVFEETGELPPAREIDHAIPLKEGSEPSQCSAFSVPALPKKMRLRGWLKKC